MNHHHWGRQVILPRLRQLFLRILKQGSIDIGKALQLLFSRMDKMEKSVTVNITGKNLRSPTDKVLTPNWKTVGSRNIVVALNVFPKARLQMGKIIFLLALVLILIFKNMEVFMEKLLIPQLRS